MAFKGCEGQLSQINQYAQPRDSLVMQTSGGITRLCDKVSYSGLFCLSDYFFFSLTVFQLCDRSGTA